MKKVIFSKLIILMGFTFGISSFLWSCRSGKTDKSDFNKKETAILDSLNLQKDYYVDVDVAYPFVTVATGQVTNYLMRNTGNSANRIDISGDGHFLKIKNDSIKGYLPFFGERRLNAGTYGGTDTSIQFDEPLETLTKEINTAKGRLQLEFRANQKGSDNDRYIITLEIYPNYKVSVHITPVFRNFMRYDGHLKELEDKK